MWPTSSSDAMNYWIDRGGFLLVLYTMVYVFQLGKPPQWIDLYSGAIAILLVGIGIEVYKRIKSNG
jgi:hypothetical protein